MATSDDIKVASIALRLVPKDEPEVSAQGASLVTLQEAVADITEAIAEGDGPEMIMVICARNTSHGLATSWYSTPTDSLLEKLGLLHVVAADLAKNGEVE